MSRRIISVAAMLAAGGAQAHVSDAQGMAHAMQHLWLLLLIPGAIACAPLLTRLLARQDRD